MRSENSEFMTFTDISYHQKDNDINIHEQATNLTT